MKLLSVRLPFSVLPSLLSSRSLVIHPILGSGFSMRSEGTYLRLSITKAVNRTEQAPARPPCRMLELLQVSSRVLLVYGNSWLVIAR